ncbi:MAG: sodium ion-translocating decarboxylase subunit beta [Clostridia bacterium]|jgi:oxaloacetate decarboxylase beta subunit|nr:sodium ion-translocating decarboxylase subunit beta [Clostridia bacterium]MDD4542956.1 sodium ion-translocating decarboxylase subunit beta [Clostridia bacterium]HXK72412.1 sodium ion-translocating decarboxylase subunit beta [Clostridia bacterium]
MLLESLKDLFNQSAFVNITWQQGILIIVSLVLLYLGIVKKFEPLLLVPIAFGMLATNLPGSNVFNPELWENMKNINYGDVLRNGGLLDILYIGIKVGLFPPLIFMGIGAMTDFGPLIANPKSFILGASAQFGIFSAYFLATKLGFTAAESGAIGIIGGADGPTAIYTASILAPHLLGAIAVAAYSYMALVPVIQPPFMKMLTTKKERAIVMEQLRPVSKTEKIIFPILVTIVVAFLIPSAAVLVASLMVGNLLKESGVTDRLSKTLQNEFINIITICLGLAVGATATASNFLKAETLKILGLGVLAFIFGTITGILFAKLMNVFSKKKINPLIGSAGVSAVPMAARISQKVAQSENPNIFLLMHAMGPNVAGVIGSAIAAGVLISLLG